MPARAPDEARCYLRRSSAKQESSLEMQLEYVIAAARQHGVRLRASPADLAHMQAKRLIEYKDIFLDDAASGTRTKRPAFDTMITKVKAEPAISHLFVHKRDRLGRPRSPLPMMMVEEDLKSAGVTIVTFEGVIVAGARGPEALGQALTSLVGYYESGEFSRKLSERVVTRHIELAIQGYSTGGIPPYGFGRFLEKPDGTLLEMARETVQASMQKGAYWTSSVAGRSHGREIPWQGNHDDRNWFKSWGQGHASAPCPKLLKCDATRILTVFGGTQGVVFASPD